MSDKKKISHISPERMERYTWHKGDLKFFKNAEELKRHADEHGEKIIWYGADKSKSAAYRNLVERAKKRYPAHQDASKNPVALVAPVVNGVNICNEINLYTYWQGFGYAVNTPKIKYLLVAQDWGNFIGTGDELKDAVAKMNAGEKIFYPYSLQSVTDKNLIELFKILGRDITKPCADVFFTNFCLGYRLGKTAGDMTKELMMRDADLFRELCEILEPENILCLGRITSECVCEALAGDAFKRIFSEAKSYNAFLDIAPQIVLPCSADKKILSRVYPLAHCGFYGTKNRPLDIQRQDWQKIVDDKKIDVAIENFRLTNSPADKDKIFDEIFARVQTNDSFIVALNEEPMEIDAAIPIFKNMKAVFLRNKHDGKFFLATFTDLFEFAIFNEAAGKIYTFMYISAAKLLHDCSADDDTAKGIILNPVSENQFVLTRDDVKNLLQSKKI